MRQWRRAWIAAAAAATLALSGCGTGTATFEKPAAPVGAQGVGGEVQGGQQPIAGATLQLYAVGTSGYGSAATALFSPAITAGTNGSFTFPSNYCPSGNPGALVYLVATGGQPAGAGTGITNSNEALMVVLGPCNGLSSSTHIHINELTTVAAVWALAPFMSGTTTAYTQVGSSSTNSTGMALAFEAAEEVVNTSTGTIGGTSLPSGATLPTSELNTLADILGYCVNSGGGTENDGSSCGTLFKNAPNAAGTGYPTDTITAAMNMAQNPGRNVSSLFAFSATPPFEPVLSAAPNAWTVAIEYTGGGLNAPTAIAADQAGNIWVANSGATSGDYYVSEFNNLGSSLLGTGTSVGADAPSALAIDLNGDAWITVKASSSLYELNTSGTLGSAITNNGLNQPSSVAIDGGGNIWVANSGGNSVSEFNSSGSAVSGSPYTGGGISAPAGIAINGNANANCSDCH